MKEYLYHLLIIFIIISNTLTSAYAQKLKIGVFDLDSMMHALPEYKAVDSLVSLFDDSTKIAYDILYNESVKIDSMFMHHPDYPDSNYMHFSDSIEKVSYKLKLSLIYWSDTAEKNRKDEIRRLSKPLYNKVNTAFERVIKNRNYNLILKPNCIVMCESFDNLFIDVARELKLTKLPDNLIHLSIMAN
jgi:Skp family chaperone for outer membrane proteins